MSAPRFRSPALGDGASFSGLAVYPHDESPEGVDARPCPMHRPDALCACCGYPLDGWSGGCGYCDACDECRPCDDDEEETEE